jgi:hypothetical protein
MEPGSPSSWDGLLILLYGDHAFSSVVRTIGFNANRVDLLSQSETCLLFKVTPRPYGCGPEIYQRSRPDQPGRLVMRINCTDDFKPRIFQPDKEQQVNQPDKPQPLPARLAAAWRLLRGN